MDERDARTVQVLQVSGPGTVQWVPQFSGPLPENGFRVDTLYSGVSAGTELTFLKDTNLALHGHWDADLGLHLDGSGGGGYPVRRFGYMQVARVVASRTPQVGVGEVLAMTYGHASGHDCDPVAERYVRLPDGLDPLLGVFVAHMGPICVNGLLHAAADAVGPTVTDLGAGVRGRRVLVTGAGVVGLLTALLAREHGAAEVVVVDPTPARLAVAGAVGLAMLDPTQHDLGVWAKQRWRHAVGDRGADVVFQCRARSAMLHAALRAVRPQGTVIDLALYPGGADDLRLGAEFHHNGLRLVCAQIGRVPRGLAHLWDRERLSAATLDLLARRGADVQAHLVTDLVPAQDAPALFTDLLARRRHVLQAVLVGPAGPR